MKNKLIIILIGIVIVILLLDVLFIFNKYTGNSVKESEKTVKIGVVMPLSGKNAIAGETSKNGIILAAEEINKKNSVDSKKYELIFEDDEDDPVKSVSAISKLIDVNNIKFIIGGVTTTTAIADVEIAEKNKVIFITTTATGSKIDSAGEYIFKLQEGNIAPVRKMSEVIESLGFNSISIIHLESEYCNEVVSLLKQKLEEKKITVLNIEKYKSSDKDFRTQLTKIKNKNPSSVFICGYYQDTGLVVKQARELGIKTQIFSDRTIENSDFIKITGNYSDGIIYTALPFDCKTSPDFCESYKTKFGKEPDYRSSYSYDSLYVLTKAIEKVGIQPDKVKQELLKTDYNGVSGRIIFDSEGNAKREFVIKTVKNGEFVGYEK